MTAKKSASGKDGAESQPKLPPPATGSGGGAWLCLLALLSILLLGCAVFWLTRSGDEKLSLRERAADMLDQASRGSPLRGLGDIVRPGPTPLPDFVVNPQTLPGTLAGRNIQGQIGAQGDSRLDGQVSPDEAAAQGPSVNALVEEPVREDSRVSGALVDELAHYLVSRYRHGSRNGGMAVSAQALNQRFGNRIGERQPGGRAAIMRYAFHPVMIQGLYNLYIVRFMRDLENDAAQRGLDSQQTRGMFRSLAGNAVLLANALDGIASMPDLASLLGREEKAAQAVSAINAQMAAAIFEADELKEGGAGKAQLSTARMRLDGIVARYRRAMDDQEKAHLATIAAIRKGAGHGLDDDTLIFLAKWVQRRESESGDSAAAVHSAASVLRDFSRRCQQAISAGDKVAPSRSGQ